ERADRTQSRTTDGTAGSAERSYSDLRGAASACSEALQRISLPARSGRRQVSHRLMREPLVQALDHGRATSGGLLRFREADDHAEADEEDQHEPRADRQSLDRRDDELQDIAQAHDSPSAGAAGFGSGTL